MPLGLSAALSFGFTFGLSAGLSYWLLLGLYQGITQQHLEDRDRRQFNQAIHHSLRNGLLLSLIGAGIIVGIGNLNVGLIIELNNTLPKIQASGVNYGLNYGVLLLCSWLLLWAATGGLTILRHYTLRLLLASSHTFPLHAQRFLDDATARVLLRRQGGGYGFVHRRLLDYFADTVLLPANTSDGAHQAPVVPQNISDLLPGTAPSEDLQH